ncbi:MAG: FAD-binding oxidoreductase [Candidatus Rokubacteria bacterium]|nr:FAD-binding oxidoreductase [Candidatus Rokubacteria bacterium]
MTAVARDVDIVIVGGGIVGASCAYFLAERGAEVLLLEAGRIGREASGVNAGGVRQQARALPEMPLALESVRLWADLERRLEVPLEYERCGDLRIVESAEDAARLRAVAARERETGLALEWVDGAALRALVPSIAPGVLGGTFCPTGGQANPLRVAAAIGRRARDLGAIVWEGCSVRALARDGEGFALDCAHGRLRASRVVLAAGAWTPIVAEGLGARLPISLFVPQMQATVPLPRVLGTVLLGFTRKLSMKQMRSGAVLVGGGKRGWGDLVTRAKGLAAESMRLGAVDAVDVLPLLGRTETTRTWVGLEGLTSDEMPIIDCLETDRVYVAAGFSGHGFAIGPVVGRLLAEWLLDGTPSMDVSAFRLNRFPTGGLS